MGDASAAETKPSGSNRTFMELKYMFEGRIHGSTSVLIVPLWN